MSQPTYLKHSSQCQLFATQQQLNLPFRNTTNAETPPKAIIMSVLPRVSKDHPQSPSPAILVPCILGLLLLIALFCLALHRWVHQDDTKTFQEIATAVRGKRSNTVTSRISNLSIDAENLRGALHKAVRSAGSAIQVRSPSPILEEREEDAGKEDDGSEIARMHAVEMSSPDREKKGPVEKDDKERVLSKGLSILSAKQPQRFSLLSTKSETTKSAASVTT